MSNQPKKEQFAVHTVKGRLAYYRAYAKWHSDSDRLGPTTWQKVRGHLYAPYSARGMKWITTISEDHTKMFSESLEDFGLRDLGDAHKLVNLRHNGWYTDNYGGGTLRGRVLKLPSRKGVEQFVPATYHDNWDGVTLHLTDICDNERDAAYRADRLAELEAEEAREEDAKQQAEIKIENAQEEIKKERKQCLALLREMRPMRRQPFTSPAICNSLRQVVKGHLAAIKKARRRIVELQKNYWSAVHS